MVKYRIHFEPIDIDDKDDFIDLYNRLRECINRLYKNDHHELLPTIRKIYPVDDFGNPIS